ncbi:Glu-tRNA(Gln) amidotransferase subunit GatD [Candidatus Micrarchaeota archaeon]|nr:Glu-tRNA(Gln) amidotransferase subunit GatD [Candidatus Micrarchaeota archaeon]
MDKKELKEKFSVKEMDEIKVFTENEEFTGVLLPSSNENSLALKMKSGYNIGIKTENVRKIEKTGEQKKETEEAETKEEKKEVRKIEGLPLILILSTGGTIASRVDYRTGAVKPAIEQEKLITNIPELMETANIESKSVYEMLSENMRFEDYKKIAGEIEKAVKEKKELKGIIVGHGTDTMHYTSAALSFMLENLNVPVILVGSQRSSDRGSSDAAMNLICATEFIAKTDFVGIAICMHENPADDNCVILSGTKSRKMHSSRRDSFKPVNDIAIARINFESRKITYLKEDYPRKKEQGKELVLRNEIEEKTALIKIYPNFTAKQLEFYEKENFKGIVLEGTGLGHAPIGNETEENKKIFEAIRKLSEKSVVVMASQAFFGRIDMNVYSTGKDLLNAGVISAEDMTPETAFIKLAWLLGNFSQEETRKLIGKNLRGEITARSDIRGFETE